MKCRYSDDKVIAITNYIVSGVCFLASIVFMILASESNSDIWMSLCLMTLGLAFINFINIYGVTGNTFLSILYIILIVAGSLLFLFGGILNATGENSSLFANELFASVFIGVAVKIIVKYLEHISTIESWNGEFMSYYGHLITIPAVLLVVSILGIFFDLWYVILFTLSYIAGFFILSVFTEYMREFKKYCLILGFVLLGLFTLICGLVAGVGVEINAETVANGDINLFNASSSLYFFLTIVMGVSFIFLTLIPFVDEYFGNLGPVVLYLIIPAMAFGLQFLAFTNKVLFLWITLGTVAFVALVLLLFKFVIMLVQLLGYLGEKIWEVLVYIFTFEWVKFIIAELKNLPGELVDAAKDALTDGFSSAWEATDKTTSEKKTSAGGKPVDWNKVNDAIDSIANDLNLIVKVRKKNRVAFIPRGYTHKVSAQEVSSRFQNYFNFDDTVPEITFQILDSK